MFKFLLLFLSISSFAKEPIIVGSKSFTESIIMSEMISLLLEEKYHWPVTRKFNLGGTKVVFDAIRNQDIDIYSDYTGTGYVMILKETQKRSKKDTHSYVSKKFLEDYNLIWSAPIGVNNTYALAIREDDENLKNINTVSDIRVQSKYLKYAAPYEFMERQDGHKKFIEKYDLKFDKTKTVSMQAGLMYTAIDSKKVDAIIVYSTDGRIKSNKLKILKDDLNFFPPYQLALVSNKKSFDKFPILKKVYEDLENSITDSEITELNNLVDGEKLSPKLVTRNFLINSKILDGKIKSTKRENLNFFQYAFKRKSFLLKLLKEHLSLSFGALFLATFFSVPLGVLLTRYKLLENIIFPIINIFQTIPSLALLGFLVPIIGIGYYPALIALFIYSLLPIVRNTYTGILAVDKSYIEASRGIGLTNFQILKKVELPLALPVILASIRTASVTVIGMATIAAFVGSGGFGDPIFRGVATVNANLILLGAIPSALLALIVDKFIGLVENALISKGIKKDKD